MKNLVLDSFHQSEITRIHNESEYTKLYEDFKGKYNFSLKGGAGTYILILSNGVFELMYRKKDNRCKISTFRYVCEYKTTSAKEMREYLQNNAPIK